MSRAGFLARSAIFASLFCIGGLHSLAAAPDAAEAAVPAAVPETAPRGVTPAADLAARLKARLQYDPLTGYGLFEKAGNRLVFAQGLSRAIFDWMVGRKQSATLSI